MVTTGPSVTVYYRAPFAGSSRPIFGHIFCVVTDGTTTQGLDYFNAATFKRPAGGPATIIRNPAKIDYSGTTPFSRSVTPAQATAMLAKIAGPWPATYRPLGPNCTTCTREVLLAGGYTSLSASILPKSLWDEWCALITTAAPAPVPGMSPPSGPPPPPGGGGGSAPPRHTQLTPATGRAIADRGTGARGLGDDDLRVA
jgi:hypothetical protein